MEFENWDRETLIKEMKSARAKNLMKFCSDEELARKDHYELRKIYVQCMINDPEFEQQYWEHQDSKKFFNKPECDADFDYWAKQAYWSIDEAITLLLEKDPRKVTWKNVEPYLSTSLFAKKFHDMREHAARYISCKQLFEPSFPGPFLAWAERMTLNIPRQLHEAVNRMGIQVCDWQLLFKDSEKNIKSQGEIIKFLEENIHLLELENIRLSEIQKFEMDPEDENYAMELDAANIIYRKVINNRDSNLTFKKQAKSELDILYPNLSAEAKKRITTIINPDDLKSGGRKKQTS